MIPVLQNDLDYINQCSFIPWEKLTGTRILVTGATGLIGRNLVNALLFAGKTKLLGLSVIVVVRDINKALSLFGVDSPLIYIQYDASKRLEYSGTIDYIVHCAYPTSSRFFIDHPVETIEYANTGIIDILRFGFEKQIKGFVFLSSMEVYGYPRKGDFVHESYISGFDPSSPRNSYPLSKKMCENLCCAYTSEYNLPTRILRLTQTFGPGVSYTDERVFAEFARCIKRKENIQLKTKGTTERSYLYTADAVTAILVTLLSGENGQIYNVANESTYCSIYQMACIAAELGGVKVDVVEQDVKKFGYTNTQYMNLDTEKIRALGWVAKTNLKEMFVNMLEAM